MPSLIRRIPWGTRKPVIGSVLDPGDPINAGLVSCWLFNESGGRIIRDIGPGANHAALGSALNWQAGQFGASVRFAGSATQSQVNCTAPRTSSLDITSSFTISSWCKQVAAQTDTAIGGKWSINGYMVYVVGGKVRVYTDGTNVASSASPFSAAGGWKHIVGVFNGTTNRVQIYIDGALDTDASNGVAVFNLANVPYEIGNYNNSTGTSWGVVGTPGSGIDNQRLYARALSAAEVKRLYIEPFAGVVGLARRFFLPTAAGGGGAYTATLTVSQASSASIAQKAIATARAAQASTALARIAAVASTRNVPQSSSAARAGAVSAIRATTQASAATRNRLFSQALSAAQASAAFVTSVVIPAGTAVLNYIVHWTRRGRRKR